MLKDDRNHPFTVRFRELMKSANEHHKKAVARPRSRDIPPHIIVQWNDEERGYGMFNTRLSQWVTECYEEYPRVFKSEEAAQDYYRTLI